MAPPPCHGCCPGVESGIVEGANSQTAPAEVARPSRPRMVGGQLPLRVAAGLYAAVLLWSIRSQLGRQADPAYAIGYVIGQVGVCLLIAAAFVLLTRLIRLRRWQGIAFLMASVIVLGCAVSSQVQQQRRAREEAEAIQLVMTAVEQMQQGTFRPGTLRAEDTGDNAVMANWVIGWFESMAAVGAKYDRAYAEVDIPAIVSPQSFTSPARTARAEAKLAQLSTLVAARKEEVFRRLDAVEAEAGALPVAPAIKEEFLRGFRSAEQATRASAERFFGIEQQFLATCAELHALMRSERGHYVVEGQEVRFDRPEAADKYYRISERLSGLEAEEKRATQDMWRSVDERMQQMETMPPGAHAPPATW